MNFFGHAAIAGRFRADPEFVLGAMLPDFCGMLRIPPPFSGADALGQGVRFHHVTDRAFHDLASFRTFCRDATALLDARRVRRGTARAVAHVGVELFIDAALAEGARERAFYAEALRAAQGRAPFEREPFRAEDVERLRALAQTLEARGVAKSPGADVIVTRLERALHSRSRLAIEARDLDAVREWVEVFRERVVASVPVVVSELTTSIERLLAT